MRKRNLPVLSHCSPGKNTVPPVLVEFFSSNVQCDPSKIKKNKVENLIKRIALSQCLQFLGSYALLTDPLVRDNLVSQRVSHFEEEMTRDRYTLADWVLVLNFESLFSSCSPLQKREGTGASFENLNIKTEMLMNEKLPDQGAVKNIYVVCKRLLFQ